MIAAILGERGKVLVVDTDESNLGLGKMLGIRTPEKTLMNELGGRKVASEQLRAALKSNFTEVISMFPEERSIDQLPPGSVSWSGPVGLLQIGKIEHSHEGCACPMGSLARDFLNKLQSGSDEWVIVDTEAGVEHFGRGVFEGVDAVLMIVDPSHEAVLLTEKAATLAEEAGKAFSVILNKTDAGTESYLKEMLEPLKIDIAGVIPYSPQISEANLKGRALPADSYREGLEKMIEKTILGLAASE
jgi:CO dehydrogenase maturation factor